MNNKMSLSILAGLLIGIGGFANLQIGGKIGALCFSIGLISIVMYDANLFTGKIGYMFTVYRKLSISYRIKIYLKMLLGNLIGAALFGLFTSFIVKDKASLLVINKLKASIIPDMFIRSIICGMLVYLGISLYNISINKQNFSLGIVLLAFSVFIFVLAQGEHCIANIYYITASRLYTSGFAFVMLFTNILGNSIGAVLMAVLHR